MSVLKISCQGLLKWHLSFIRAQHHCRWLHCSLDRGHLDGCLTLTLNQDWPGTRSAVKLSQYSAKVKLRECFTVLSFHRGALKHSCKSNAAIVLTPPKCLLFELFEVAMQVLG